MITGVINIIFGLLLVGWCEKRTLGGKKPTLKIIGLVILGFALMALGIFKLVHSAGWI